jgi:hypothetical protein
MGVKQATSSRLLEAAALITDATRRLEGVEFESHGCQEYWENRMAIRELKSAGNHVKNEIECGERKREGS